MSFPRDTKLRCGHILLYMSLLLYPKIGTSCGLRLSSLKLTNKKKEILGSLHRRTVDQKEILHSFLLIFAGIRFFNILEISRFQIHCRYSQAVYDRIPKRHSDIPESCCENPRKLVARTSNTLRIPSKHTASTCQIHCGAGMSFSSRPLLVWRYPQRVLGDRSGSEVDVSLPTPTRKSAPRAGWDTPAVSFSFPPHLPPPSSPNE